MTKQQARRLQGHFILSWAVPYMGNKDNVQSLECTSKLSMAPWTIHSLSVRPSQFLYEYVKLLLMSPWLTVQVIALEVLRYRGCLRSLTALVLSHLRCPYLSVRVFTLIDFIRWVRGSLPGTGSYTWAHLPTFPLFFIQPLLLPNDVIKLMYERVGD